MANVKFRASNRTLTSDAGLPINTMFFAAFEDGGNR